MYPIRRYLSPGLIAGLAFTMMLFASGISYWAIPLVLAFPPPWLLPACSLLVVPAGQTASITVSGKTTNFNYDPTSNWIITDTMGVPGGSGFLPSVGGVYYGSDLGDCTTLMVTPYFVVFFFRPLSVLKLMGIEY